MLSPSDINHSMYPFGRKVHIQLFILISIPLLVMGFVSARIYTNISNREHEARMEYHLKTLMQQPDATFSLFRQYYSAFATGSDCKALIDQQALPHETYQQVKTIQRELAGNNIISGNIDSYYFINRKWGWILSNLGSFSFMDLKDETPLQRLLSGADSTSSSIFWINQSSIPSPFVGGVTIMHMVDDSGNLFCVKGDNNDYLLVVKPNNVWLNNLEEASKAIGYDIAVFAGDVLLFSTNEELKHAKDVDDSLFKGESRKLYILKKAVSGTSGLTYVLGYDTTSPERFSNLFERASFIILIITLLAILFLRGTFGIFSKPLFSLQESLTRQQEKLRQNMERTILGGTAKEEDVQTYISTFPVHVFPMLQYLAIGPKIAGQTNVLEFADPILNEANGILRAMVQIQPIVIEEILCIVLGAAEAEGLEEAVVTCYKLLQRGEACPISIGCSRVFSDLAQCSIARDEALEAMLSKQSDETETSSITVCNGWETNGFAWTAFDNLMDTELYTTIKEGNLEMASKLLDLTVKRFDERRLTGIERKQAVSRLIAQILTIPNQAGMRLEDVFSPSEYHAITAADMASRNSSALKAFLISSIIRPITVKIKQMQDTGDSFLVRKTIAMIDEANGDTTLSECADALGCHPNTIGKVLKACKKTTFSELVNEQKIRRAKYLLLANDMKVGDIAQNLGYQNAQNFTRFFTSQTGLTPSEFKRLSRKGEQND